MLPSVLEATFSLQLLLIRAVASCFFLRMCDKINDV